jgi:16S rRNA (cytidine1402-2'-O)-methyltransferase
MSAVEICLLALPIGNPEDLTFRGKKTLEVARVIFCEDSRKLQALLKDRQIQTAAKWITIPGDEEWNFDYSELARSMKNGDVWVLVSDAGTPGVNDPGRALVEWALQNGKKVQALPGPSAVTAALQWCGGFGLPFSFLGFAPKLKATSQQDWKKFFAPGANSKTLVFFDTRHQVLATLQALIDLGYAKKELFIAREITKTFEELLQGNVEEMHALLTTRLKNEGPLGELTLVLKGWAQDEPAAISMDLLMKFRSASTKEASKIAAELSGMAARDCYKMLLDKEDDQ